MRHGEAAQLLLDARGDLRREPPPGLAEARGGGDRLRPAPPSTFATSDSSSAANSSSAVQPGARLLEVGEHLVGRAAVLAHEPLELVVAELERVAVRGVHVELVDVVAQRRGEVVELHGERAEPLRQRRDALVEQRRLVDQALRHAHAVERGRLGLAGQQGERAAGALEQLAGVPRPLAVDGQALVLARLDAGRLDLVAPGSAACRARARGRARRRAGRRARA